MARLSRFLWNILNDLGQLISLVFNSNTFSRLLRALSKCLAISATAISLVYLSIFITIGNYAKQLINTPPTLHADAALILGNRAYLNGKPNPCLTGRVDEGLLLEQQGLVNSLVMTGGVDFEDKRIEAQVMESYARDKGFKGTILLESRSSSTLENLRFSRPILEAAGFNHIIITSEPFHMWRVKRLVDAGHLDLISEVKNSDHKIKVDYAAAPSQCWANWGMAFKGALREPLAVINNYAKGYF